MTNIEAQAGAFIVVVVAAGVGFTLGWFAGRRRGMTLGHLRGRADGLSDAVMLLRRELAVPVTSGRAISEIALHEARSAGILRPVPDTMPGLRLVKGGEP